MSSRRKKFEQKIGFLAFEQAEKSFLKRTPEQAERLGEKLAMLAWRIDKKHRLRTIANLELAMPELDARKRLELAKNVWRHFGRTTSDFMRAEARTSEEIRSCMTVEGAEYFYEAKAMKKGVIAVTGHFGNWERFAHWMTLEVAPLTVVARDADETGINEAMLRKRKAQGVEILSRGNTVRQILGLLKHDKLVAILPDQNSNEAFVPFFNKPCGTVLGPGVLSLRTGAPIVPAFCAQVGPGKYLTMVRPMVQVPEDQRTPEGIMAVVQAELEAVIRKYPDQWLWMHDRWKSARRAGYL